MADNPKVTLTNVSLSGAGVISSKVAAYHEYFTLSNLAAALTCIYTAILIYQKIMEMLEQRKARKNESPY